MLYEDLLVTSGEDASVIVILTVATEPARSSFQNPTGAIAPGNARLTIRQLAAGLGVNLLVGTTRIGTNVTNNSPIVLDMPTGRHILGANFATAKKHAFAPSCFSL